MSCCVSEFTGVDVSSTVANAVTQFKSGLGTGNPLLTLDSVPTNLTYTSWFQENWHWVSAEGTQVHLVDDGTTEVLTAYDAAGDQTPTATLQSDLAHFWTAVSVELKESSSTISITSVNSGNPVATGATNIPVVGTGLDTVTSITIEGDSQTIDAGATDTNLTFDLVQNSFAFGTYTITFGDGVSTVDSTITVEEAAGKTSVVIGSFIEPDTNERIVTSPDLQTGWILEYDTIAGLTILDSGAVEYTGELTEITFDVRVFDNSAWGATQSITITVDQGLSGTISGVSTTSGEITLQAIVSGSVSGSSTTSGSVLKTQHLSGSALGTSSMTGTFIGSSYAISGSVLGSSSTSGSILAQYLIGGVSSGTSTTTAVLDIGLASTLVLKGMLRIIDSNDYYTIR